jgi:hypothetical protein
VTRSIERDRGRLTTRAGTTHNARRPMLPHYLIAGHEAHGPELLHVPLESGEEMLPVFSSEVAARDFLLSNALGQAWYVREFYAGELVSLLLGLYADIEWVLIDPLPEEHTAEDKPAAIAHWKSFVDYLLGSKYRLFSTLPQPLVLTAVPPKADELSLRREGVSS